MSNPPMKRKNNLFIPCWFWLSVESWQCHVFIILSRMYWASWQCWILSSCFVCFNSSQSCSIVIFIPISVELLKGNSGSPLWSWFMVLGFTFMHGRRQWQPTPLFLAWRIPGTGEPAGLPSVGSHRVGHGWSDLAAAAAEPLDVLAAGQNLGQRQWPIRATEPCVLSLTPTTNYYNSWLYTEVIKSSLFFREQARETVACPYSPLLQQRPQ